MTIQATTVLIGFIVASIISIISKKLKLLTLSGAIAATIIGSIVFGIGGSILSASMIWFFVSSNLLGKFRRSRKSQLGYEKPGARDGSQVFSNGAVAAGMALAASIFPHLRESFIAGSLAAIASSASDTWATEVGSAMASQTYLITSFAKVRTGQSGGVSTPGSVAAIVASVSISAMAYAFGLHNTRILIVVCFAGILGCVLDSLLGATAQVQYQRDDGAVVETPTPNTQRLRGATWVTNDTVNFVSSVAAAAIAFMLIQTH